MEASDYNENAAIDYRESQRNDIEEYESDDPAITPNGGDFYGHLK